MSAQELADCEERENGQRDRDDWGVSAQEERKEGETRGKRTEREREASRGWWVGVVLQ